MLGIQCDIFSRTTNSHKASLNGGFRTVSFSFNTVTYHQICLLGGLFMKRDREMKLVGTVTNTKVDVVVLVTVS